MPQRKRREPCGGTMDTKQVKETFCRTCDTYFLSALWKDAEVFCDDCGSHPAMVCPGCDSVFHSVSHSEEMQERLRPVPAWQVGDTLVSSQGVCRVILAVRETGYTWTYPFLVPVEPPDMVHTWISENSMDPFFELMAPRRFSQPTT